MPLSETWRTNAIRCHKDSRAFHNALLPWNSLRINKKGIPITTTNGGRSREVTKQRKWWRKTEGLMLRADADKGIYLLGCISSLHRYRISDTPPPDSADKLPEAHKLKGEGLAMSPSPNPKVANI